MPQISRNKTSLFIAWRFIFSEKRLKAINIITRISILGVIVGVMTLVVVLSVLNGFQDLARSLFLSVDSDIQITAGSGKHIFRDEKLLQLLKEMPEIESANFYVQDKAILVGDEKSGVVVLKGLENEAFHGFKTHADLAITTDSLNGLMVGHALAMKFDMYVSANVRLFGSAFLDKALTILNQPFLPPPAEPPIYQVSNFFSSHRSFDEQFVILPLRSAQQVLAYPENWVTGIDLRAPKNSDHNILKEKVLKVISSYHSDDKFQVTTLEEKYRQLFDVMALEKWGSFLVLMMIILVASLSLIGSLTMTSIEKKRDLYFLRCIGMQPKHIKHIFMLEGLLIALIGVILGIMLGGLLCFLQQNYGIVSLPSKDAFIIDAYPVSVDWFDFVVVAMGSIFVCVAASFYPAKRAIELSETRAAH